MMFHATQHQMLGVGRGVDVVERRPAPVTLHGHIVTALLHKRRARVIAGPGQHRVVQGNVDVIALPGLALAEQGHHHAGKGDERPRHIGRRHAGVGRFAVASAMEVERTRQRFDGDVVGGLVAVHAGLAEGRNGAVHNLRGVRAHRVVVQPQTFHHAGPKPFHQHVGVGQQFEQKFNAARVFEVQLHAALAAMGVAEPHAVAALAQAQLTRGLTTGRFDADHVRAVVGHHHREMRPGQKHGKVDDFNARKLHAAVLQNKTRLGSGQRPGAPYRGEVFGERAGLAQSGMVLGTAVIIGTGRGAHVVAPAEFG